MAQPSTSRRLSVTSLHQILFSKTDFDEAVKAYLHETKYHVERYNIKSISELKSFFGKYGELRVDARDTERKKTIYFLLQSTRRENCQIIVTNTPNGFSPEKFIHFILLVIYRKVFRNVQEFLYPNVTCYFVKDDVAVMEHLLQYKYANTNHFDEEHIKMVLQTLAILHGITLTIEVKLNLQLTTRYARYFTEPIYYQETGNSHFSLFQAIIDSIKLYVEQEEKQKPKPAVLDEYLEYFFFLMKQENYLRKVICHGNVIEKTILFRYDKRQPVDCKLLNFLLMRYAPPAFDVMQFLVFCVDNEQRKENYSNYLKHYYNNLREFVHRHIGQNLQEFLTYSEFDLTCKIYLQACKFMKVLYDIFNNFVTTDSNNLMGVTGFNLEKIVDQFRENEDEVVWRLDELTDSIDDDVLSDEDVYEIAKNLVEAKDFTISDKNIEQINRYDSTREYQYFRMTMTIMRENTRNNYSFFIKALRYTDRRQYLDIRSNLYLKSCKEHWFYMYFLRETQDYDVDITPVFSKCIKSRNNDLLVFHELGMEYEKMSRLQSFNYETVKVVLQNLAKLHGSSIIIEEKESRTRKQPFRIIQEHEKYFVETVFSECEEKKKLFDIIKHGICIKIDVFKASAHNVTGDLLKEKIRLLCDKVFSLVKPSPNRRNVMCHGTLWAENILFKRQGDKILDCRFIGMDTFRYNTPAQDVMAFIHIATDRTFRNTYLHKVTQFYYDCLKRFLNEYDIDVRTVIEYAEFVANCQENIIFGLILTCYILHAIETREYMAMFFDTDVKEKQIQYKATWDFITNLCHIDARFKKKQQETIAEFLDLFKTTLTI